MHRWSESERLYIELEAHEAVRPELEAYEAVRPVLEACKVVKPKLDAYDLRRSEVQFGGSCWLLEQGGAHVNASCTRACMHACMRVCTCVWFDSSGGYMWGLRSLWPELEACKIVTPETEDSEAVRSAVRK